MKKVVGSLLMTSTMLLGALAPIVANAADGENRSGTTDTTATFTANTTNPVDPVDPTDPTKPLNPGDGDNGASAGAGLSLIYAPSKLGFGSNQIDVINNQSYAADADSTVMMGTTNKVGLQVSDQRGTNAGWTLSVAAADGTDGNLSSLKGATLSLPAGTVTSTGATAGSGSTAGNGATGQAVDLDLGSQASTSAGATFTGATSGVVLTAADKNGAGITSDLLDPTAVKLNVVANTASATTYKGVLNWTLTSSADN
ncbi:WxL domain-containing protein [Lactiplantibacillus pentosus]|uniref:WxL domain-containing protein n=1 Tax=Lactiplantibacillus pentosus TaxID=1589 RepID=UPI00132FE2DF|nr:WxL domain-containing protein [Lactiplantibacillus pentosus]MBQ0835717.1 WxL domain-containing protein [Lactiplantibacillus pentosus]MBU7463926.1 WxL domain-containing protein [Lactiplantibacillus pentosus]MBU7489841.1 WxL domain-containing protein [Lactiplantibacillus pentosus]MBU7493277.1 WxL domain-containing protein [Lactiplantibacillus pentosus]MBU7519277.1 WxL domain-containing protein [Lactiplantibacillus pentosus]